MNETTVTTAKLSDLSEWIHNEYKELRSQGFSCEDALHTTLQEWAAVADINHTYKTFIYYTIFSLGLENDYRMTELEQKLLTLTSSDE